MTLSRALAASRYEFSTVAGFDGIGKSPAPSLVMVHLYSIFDPSSGIGRVDFENFSDSNDIFNRMIDSDSGDDYDPRPVE